MARAFGTLSLRENDLCTIFVRYFVHVRSGVIRIKLAKVGSNLLSWVHSGKKPGTDILVEVQAQVDSGV